MLPRVVVTGLGVVSRRGGLDASWDAALAGRRDEARIDPEALGVSGRRLDPVARFAIAAARAAWRDAASSAPPARRAVILGTSRGPLESQESARGGRVGPHALAQTLPSAPVSAVSIDLDCRGPAFGLTAACASAAHAIGVAARLLQAGAAEVALAGGAEACLTPAYLAMARRAGILAAEQCRPFDLRRDGTVMGEGAGILVLETRERALARGARIRAELLGYGASSDAESLHAPAVDGGALAAAMREALREAGVAPSDLAWIKAHGTGTEKGDAAEAAALRAVLGGARVPVGSLKPVLGHAVGAAGALEAALLIRALEERRIPPTAGLEQPDPALGLELPRSVVPAGAGPMAANAAGFGGTNACLVFGRA